MSQEEEVTTTRVTRGALRRRSIDQDPASAPVTPKKSTVSKKVAVLDAIQEGNNGLGESNAEDDSSSTTRATRAKKDTPSTVTNKVVQKLKDQEEKGGRRSRTSSLTEENLASFEPSSAEVRRTPRRRASQDISLTPQTAPPTGRRMTRRNSVASDDGSTSALPATTPKATISRLSVASTIAEDDEKEVSSSKLETQSPDKSVRKLRGRSVSISPVPKNSPSGKNTSISSRKSDGGDGSFRKEAKVLLETVGNSPEKEVIDVSSNESNVSVEGEAGDQTPNKSRNLSVKQKSASTGSSAHKLSRNVTFDEEDTPDRQSSYPKTPIPASGEKRFKFNEEDHAQDEGKKISKSTPEMFDVDESPDETSPKKAAKSSGDPQQQVENPNKSESSGAQLDESVDASLVEIVDDVRKSLNRDMSMSVLDTPTNKVDKQKSHFSRLRSDGGSCSTPIAKAPVGTPLKEQLQKVGSPKFVSNTPDGRGTQKKATEESKLSKSWSQAVKGKGNDKGIDVFSIRKQEQQRRDEEQAEQLNKERKELSRKRKSEEKSSRDESEEEVEGEDNSEDEEEIEATQRNSFVDDEAMEADGYNSGDSLDSETRENMKENEIPIDGESIGSEDSEDGEQSGEEASQDEEEVEEEEDDSFIVSDEEMELLDGTDEEISDVEEMKSRPKKRKRIIERVDSSEEENESKKAEKDASDTSNKVCATDNKKVSRIEINSSSDASKIEPAVDESILEKTTTNASPAKNDSLENSAHSKSPLKSVKKERKSLESSLEAKTPLKSPKSETKPSKGSTRLSLTEKEGGKKEDRSILESATSATDKAAVSSTKKKLQAPNSEPIKVRKSLPASPVLISADFYASSAKKARRATVNVLSSTDDSLEQVPSKEEPVEESKKTKLSKSMVSNPAAIALAKKNKRMSLDIANVTPSTSLTAGRMSLPGKLSKAGETETPPKKKKSNVDELSRTVGQETDSKGLSEADKQPAAVEAMEVDEEQQSNDEQPKKVGDPVVRKKPADLSEFNHEAILSRCNEEVRAIKERRQQSATLRQKKKDEKRQNREQEKQAETTEGDDSMEQQKKKKKRKKKQVNYLLEELGETREEQLQRALKRKMELLEAKRERKRAKKAAKLQQQLNKENQQGGEEKQQGIGAKFEKKAKKKQKQTNDAAKVEVPPIPVQKLNVSAFTVYRNQIEELKQNEKQGKKKEKQLKEKNQLTSAVQEVLEALQPVSKVDKKLENSDKKSTKPANLSENNLGEAGQGEIQAASSKEKHHSKKAAKKLAESAPIEIPSVTHDHSEKKVKKTKKPEHTLVPDEPQVKLRKKDLSDSIPAKPIISLDDELAKLKKSLAKPLEKVVKKQKLSQKESMFIAEPVEVVSTPPRKGPGLLKALQFLEEPVTPEQKLLKRNHGFKEEPVTPKPIGFKVSSILTADRDDLQEQAVLGNKKKSKSNRNRTEDVKEPSKMLPLPIWTRSGTFEEEPVKKNHSKSGDYIPLKVSGGGGSGKHSTEFLLKSLDSKSKEEKRHGAKPGRIDPATVSGDVLNFKKESIFARNAHLREKKSKH